jgi:hypothetical protein
VVAVESKVPVVGTVVAALVGAVVEVVVATVVAVVVVLEAPVSSGARHAARTPTAIMATNANAISFFIIFPSFAMGSDLLSHARVD